MRCSGRNDNVLSGNHFDTAFAQVGVPGVCSYGWPVVPAALAFLVVAIPIFSLFIPFIRAVENNVLFFNVFLHVDRQAVKIKELHFKGYVTFSKYLIELQ